MLQIFIKNLEEDITLPRQKNNQIHQLSNTSYLPLHHFSCGVPYPPPGYHMIVYSIHSVAIFKNQYAVV